VEPALAAIELNSIARGMRTTDEMAKKALVQVLESAVICPGKYIVLVGGPVGPVEEAFAKGKEIGGEYVVDQLFLPNAHEQLFGAINATAPVETVAALGVAEFFSVTAGILAADAACKAAEVTLIELRLARGMAGKSFFTLTGELHMVEAAIAAAEHIIADASGFTLRTEVIANPHPDLVRHIL
jgi:microcompartment protein CcmL/EutN